MSQVLLKLLRQQHPTAIIDMLAPVWARTLIQRMPEVHQVHSITLGHGQLGIKQRWQLGKSLRDQGYTQAIVLPNSWKSALPAFAAKIPLRTGWLGEYRWGLLNDVRYLNKAQLPLMIQRFYALGQDPQAEMPTHLPYPHLEITATSVNAVLVKCNLEDTRPVLALCPGAEYGPAKRWPMEYYAEVAKQKIAEGWQVWLFGSAKDQAIATGIQQLTAQSCIDLTGRTTLGEAVDLLSLAQVVLTNDSGLMHVAAALNKPLIALYGSSSPRFTPPLSDKVKILSLDLACSPCFQRECPLEHLKCLRDLVPKTVISAIDTI